MQFGKCGILWNVQERGLGMDFKDFTRLWVIVILTVIGLILIWAVLCVFNSKASREICTNFCESNSMKYFSFMQGFDTNLNSCGCCPSNHTLSWDRYSGNIQCLPKDAIWYSIRKGD
jgi:hypothetical protein